MSMTAQFIFKKACNDSVTDYIERNLIILGTVGLVIGIFEVSIMYYADNPLCNPSSSSYQVL